MTDLLRTLYEYALANQDRYTSGNPEYQDNITFAKKKEALLRERLGEDETRLLDDMLGEMKCGGFTESEALFLSAVELCRELNGILRH